MDQCRWSCIDRKYKCHVFDHWNKRPLGQARQSRHMSRRQRSSWSASRRQQVRHAEHCGEEQCIFNLSCSCLSNCRRRRSRRRAAAPSTPYVASTATCSEKFNTKVNLNKPTFSQALAFETRSRRSGARPPSAIPLVCDYGRRSLCKHGWRFLLCLISALTLTFPLDF